MKSFRAHFSPRLAWMALVGCLGALSCDFGTPIGAHDEKALWTALGGRVDGEVSAVVWEPEQSRTNSVLLGRPLLFTARASGPETVEGDEPDLEPLDLYRAFIRLTPEGGLLAVRSVHPLSRTHLASEVGLTTNGNVAAYVSVDDSGPVGVTLLQFGGEKLPRDVSLWGRIQLALSRLIATGDLRGLGRTDIELPAGTEALHLTEDGPHLVLTAQDQRLTLDRTTLKPTSPQEAWSIQEQLRVPKPFLHFVADSARATFGKEPVAWAESSALKLKDRVRQLGFRVASPKATPAPPRIQKLTPSLPEEEPVPWPPAAIASPWTNPEEGEGIWHAVGQRMLKERGGKEPLFFSTFVRADPERPYAKTVLVAMDMTRLDLGIAAGYEDPHPETGPPGTGHIPEHPSAAKRVVATFNGGFKGEHGAYGMRTPSRLLVPAKDGAATVRIDADGRIGLGTWKAGTEDLSVSFRQNLDALLEDGALLPTGRQAWGDQLSGQGTAAERSGLCVTQEGRLLYGWSQEATPRSLARAFQMAGCTYAMHLDMNPGHCAFTFNQVDSFEPLRAVGEVLDSRMKVSATRYLRWSPKDFFYLSLRTSQPEPLKTRPSLKWTPAPKSASHAGGASPILRAQDDLAGLTIDIDRLDLNRLQLSVLPGTEEPGQAKAPPHAEAPLLAITVGHATRGNRTGLSLDGASRVPLDRKYASLVLDAKGSPSLLPPGVVPKEGPGVSSLQLPALVKDAHLLPEAREIGGRRERSALCLDTNGYLLVARMNHDTSAPLAQLLVELGCQLVVEGDRGSHSEPRVERAGTDAPPEAERSGTRLAVVPGSPRARAYHF